MDFSINLLRPSAIFVYFLLICGVFPTALHQPKIDDPKKQIELLGSTDGSTNSHGGGFDTILSRKKRQAEEEEELLARLQLFICNFGSHFSNDDDVDVGRVEIDGPFGPILKFFEIILKDQKLFKAASDLPRTKDFVSFITIAMKYTEGKYIDSIKAYVARNRLSKKKMKVFKSSSNEKEFKKLRNILCSNVTVTEESQNDLSDEGEIDDEQNISPYCKRLFIDAIKSNHGKVTWASLKPFMQGKIIYGPFNDDTKEIIALSNKPFDDITRLRQIIAVSNKASELFKNDEEFQKNYNEFLHNSFLVTNPETIQTILQTLYNKTQTSESLQVFDNALGCFSVDRFVPMNDENELDASVRKLMKTNELLAGVYFKNIGKEPAYRMIMRFDNKAIMIDNNNGMWFPHGSVQLERHHIRGFSKIQELIDDGLTKHYKKKYENIERERMESQNSVQTTTSSTSQTNFDDIMNSYGVSPSDANSFLKSNNISMNDVFSFLKRN